MFNFSGLLAGQALADYTNPGQCELGKSCYGRNQYIEYIKGNLPIIISAPHGGYLYPSEIPDRTKAGCTGSDSFVVGRDTNSQEYARGVWEDIKQLTGKYPHIIINHLARKKLDANRYLDMAACDHQWAEQAWYEYHEFIDYAKSMVHQQCVQGQYFDFHTSGHEMKWIELGYLLGSSDLSHSDEQLNSATYIDKSSIKNLIYRNDLYFPEVIRGETSLSGYLQNQGYSSLPSPLNPDPEGNPYFTGGYNTAHFGSRGGGTINGLQIETQYSFISSSEKVNLYARALAESIIGFVNTQYQFDLAGNICSTATPTLIPPTATPTIIPCPGNNNKIDQDDFRTTTVNYQNNLINGFDLGYLYLNWGKTCLAQH